MSGVHEIYLIFKLIQQNQYSIAIVAPFSGLRRFPQGRGFKQWTGDDSKALMKVFLPAIEGLVPVEMVRCVRAFLEFCYLVRRDFHDTKSLEATQEALNQFHHYRDIFKDVGIRDDFNLPRQHSLRHYIHLIREYGSPNGICSSITENKHIKAVKEPWRRSSKWQAMRQMLISNQRMDKLAVSRTLFKSRGMLKGTCLSDTLYRPGEQFDFPTTTTTNRRITSQIKNI